MTPIRVLAPSFLAVALVSCASQKADTYDTPVQAAVPSATQSANPVYDTAAVYEESTPTASAPPLASPGVPTAANIPAAPSNGAAVIHTVVAGDTLGGISAKYKVPTAAIMQANNMTKDTVVLGRKMVIPPVR